MTNASDEIVIIGAGPAGLTAAYELTKHQEKPIVLERGSLAGGISRTEVYKGYHLDIGGHRFYTKVDEIEQLWHEILHDELIRVPRLSRIYYNGKYFRYPLEFRNALWQLGLWESVLVLMSYIKARMFLRRPEESFEDWVINRFGERLFYKFFKTYTEKVWGIPTDAIRADWAAQRIQELSFVSAVTSSLLGNSKEIKSLIHEFEYPRYGPGQMWQAVQERIESAGAQVHFDTEVSALHIHEESVVRLDTKSGQSFAPEHVISSMPIKHLINCIVPQAPPQVKHAANSLHYRDFLIVGLIVRDENLFPDNWIYVHTPQVHVGRIQNVKSWSADMIPDADMNCLGMEYFCNETDDLWNMTDDDLVKLATRELAQLELARTEQMLDGFVVRQREAYPVYDEHYRDHLQVIEAYIASIQNLQTVGRNGMHRYNNQDHSMLTGLLAARNILGEHHNLWQVNVERSYYESFELEKPRQRKVYA